MADESEFPELTEQELRDVVCVRKPANPFESELFQDILEEHGIPCAAVGEALPFGAMGFAALRLMVPRVLAQEAEAVLKKAELEARREGVRQALAGDAASGSSGTSLEPEDADEAK